MKNNLQNDKKQNMTNVDKEDINKVFYNNMLHIYC